MVTEEAEEPAALPGKGAIVRFEHRKGPEYIEEKSQPWVVGIHLFGTLEWMTLWKELLVKLHIHLVDGVEEFLGASVSALELRDHLVPPCLDVLALHERLRGNLPL